MTGTVFALSGPTYYGGWVGTSVVAQKDIEVGGSSWNGKIDSYTQYRNPIGTIGWTYWTIRETCYGNIINQYVYSGYAEFNDDHAWDVAVDSISYCSTSPNGHEGRVLGNHEFKNVVDDGDDGQYYEWYKDWTHKENLFLQD